jgi:hypothetical protein
MSWRPPRRRHAHSLVLPRRPSCPASPTPTPSPKPTTLEEDHFRERLRACDPSLRTRGDQGPAQGAREDELAPRFVQAIEAARRKMRSQVGDAAYERAWKVGAEVAADPKQASAFELMPT